MAAELDEIGKNLSGIERFTKEESSATRKLEILNQIKSYIKTTGWAINGLSHKETLEHLDTLIEFCKRAENKGLDVWVWA